MSSGEQMMGAALANFESVLTNSFLVLALKEPRTALQLAYLSGLNHGIHLDLTPEGAKAFERAVAKLVKGKQDEKPQ